MNTLTTQLTVTDGEVDFDASVESFTAALEAHITERKAASVGVAEAVASVFAENPGSPIAMPVLASLAAQKLGAQPANYSTISERVLDYVRANTKSETSLFVSKKGRGGGISVRA